MELLTTAIVAAIAAGAAKGTGEAATKFVVDGYASLRGLLKRKFGDDGSVAKAVQGLEDNPASEGRKQVLNEELNTAHAAQDPDVLKLAKELLTALQDYPGGAQHVQQATGSFISQADRNSMATVNVNK